MYHIGKMDDFNAEEEAYGWSISQYPQRKKIHDKLTPFLRLYETATDFLQQQEQWLNGPLSGVNPDKVLVITSEREKLNFIYFWVLGTFQRYLLSFF